MPRINWSIFVLLCILGYLGVTHFGWFWGIFCGVIVCFGYMYSIYCMNTQRSMHKQAIEDRIHEILLEGRLDLVSLEDIIFVITYPNKFIKREMDKVLACMSERFNESRS